MDEDELRELTQAMTLAASELESEGFLAIDRRSDQWVVSFTPLGAQSCPSKTAQQVLNERTLDALDRSILQHLPATTQRH